MAKLEKIYDAFLNDKVNYQKSNTTFQAIPLPPVSREPKALVGQ